MVFISLFSLLLLVSSIISELAPTAHVLDKRADYDPSLISVTNNMQKPSIANAKLGISYAAVTKCSDTLLKSWSCKECSKVPNTIFVKSFSSFTFGTRGYIAIDNNSKEIVLAFRGSVNVANTINNLNFVQKDISEISDKKAKVHSGFYNSMNSLASQFLTVIQTLINDPKYKAYNIKLIGHSLGGAMASLAALKLQSSLKIEFSRMTLYTYGQPRTGNLEFAKYYDLLPISAARVVNFNDMIPHNPPNSISNYSHHGNELFINDNTNTNAIYCNNTVVEDRNCS